MKVYLVFVWCLFAGMLLNTAVAQELAITNVSVNPRTIDLADPRHISIKFQLNAMADVDVEIYDARDFRIASIPADKLAAGEHTLTWNLKTDDGDWVLPEAYYFVLHAKNEAGSVSFDLSDKTGGEEVEAIDIYYDENKNKVLYTLNTNARFYLRYGIQQGPMMGTLLNGVIRQKGVYAEPWDGYDQSGVLSLINHPRLHFYGAGYALSRNAIVVSDSRTPLPVKQEWIQLDEEKIILREAQRKPLGLSSHAYQRPDYATDFDIQLEALETAKTDKGEPILTGPTQLRVTLSDFDSFNVEMKRFETSFFVDGQLLYENEISYSPYTWKLDTSRLPKGEHYITAFVIAFGGYFGVDTIKVVVE